MAAFPIQDPKYIVLTIMDEPKLPEERCGVTAGCNAGVMAGEIIRRSAPMLGVKPRFGHDGTALLESY